MTHDLSLSKQVDLVSWCLLSQTARAQGFPVFWTLRPAVVLHQTLPEPRCCSFFFTDANLLCSLGSKTLPLFVFCGF